MTKATQAISRLFSLRNHYEKNISGEKLQLINKIIETRLSARKDLQAWYNILLFFIAYPDNAHVHQVAVEALQRLQLYIQSNEKIKDRLFNSGITNTELSAAF